jgi:hypothetical protein
MALLTPGSVHIDQPLTNLTIAYLQNTTGFVSDKVFPRVSVAKKTDKYYIYDRDQFNRVGEVQERAPRTRAPRVGMKISQDAYTTKVYSLGADFDFETMANEDAVLDIKSAQTAQLTQLLTIDREVKWASAYFKTGVWATDWDGVSGVPAANQVRQWSDYVNSNPIVDVMNIRRTMQLRSGGFKPNKMVIGKEVRDTLINHPVILGRLNGGATVSNTALVTDAKLAEIFEVGEFMVMEAVQNTAKEGLTETNTFIGGKHVGFFYTPPAAGKMVASSGYTFVWDELDYASGYGITIKTYTGDFLAIEGIAESVEVNMAYDHKVVGNDLGAFIENVIA